MTMGKTEINDEHTRVPGDLIYLRPNQRHCCCDGKSQETIDFVTVHALVAMKSVRELPMQWSCHEMTGWSAHARDPRWRQKNRIDFSSSLFASNDVSFLLFGCFPHKRE